MYRERREIEREKVDNMTSIDKPQKRTVPTTHREHERRVPRCPSLLVDVSPSLLHQCHNDGHTSLRGGQVEGRVLLAVHGVLGEGDA